MAYTHANKKILVVFGTRPEAIKMAPVVDELRKHSNKFETKVCVTAQHRDMLDQVLELFHISPDYDLNIMKQSQDLYDISSEILLKMRRVLSEFEPDLILVHGDTTTSCISSLAAFYKKIKVGHIEAGLRTNELYSPWPEEANRQITSVLADYHFAPTELSRKNLLLENKNKNNVVVTGNTVIDALFMALANIKNDLNRKEKILSIINEQYNADVNRKFILVTVHRRESFGIGIENICEALQAICKQNPDIDIILPVHPNPNIRSVVENRLSDIDNIYLFKPLDYDTFVYLMSKSFFILTDSGGIQEEAPSLGKPVLVMRENTERPEAILSGTVKLVGTDAECIAKEVEKLMKDKKHYNDISSSCNPYGDGGAARRIVSHIASF